MGALLCLALVISGAAADNIALEVYAVLQHILKR